MNECRGTNETGPSERSQTVPTRTVCRRNYEVGNSKGVRHQLSKFPQWGRNSVCHIPALSVKLVSLSQDSAGQTSLCLASSVGNNRSHLSCSAMMPSTQLINRHRFHCIISAFLKKRLHTGFLKVLSLLFAKSVTICNRQNLYATQASNNRWAADQVVVFTHNRRPLSR